MNASFSPRFHPRHLDVTIVGDIDIHAAVQVTLLLDAARSYYRYPKVQLDLTHARVRSRAATHLREHLRAVHEGGLCVVLIAADRVRARLEESPVGPTVPAVRRVGFAP